MTRYISRLKQARGTFILAALLISTPGFADVKDGVDAWTRGDYATAIREWRKLADAGDADAQFNLAQAYRLGRGVERDLAKAESLYGMAAQSGHLGAADNYGILLFQRGERARAMPYVHAAAERGDSRAQYILGLAYFNGDNVPKDWTRAYALVSLSQQAGLPAATAALAQMDKYIPLDQRQRSVALAAELASKAEATRARQVAAADLGVDGAGQVQSLPQPSSSIRPFQQGGETLTPADRAVAAASRAAGNTSPAEAGADYTRAGRSGAYSVPPVSRILETERAPAPPRPAPVAAPPPPRPVPVAAPVRVSSGPWRLQLGAFGVPGNADRLWNKVKGRPELAGHGKLMVPAGRVTKLQAGGFASRAEAEAACARLKAGGFDCLPVQD